MKVRNECHGSVIYYQSKMEADCTYFAEDLRMTKPANSCIGSSLMTGESLSLYNCQNLTRKLSSAHLSRTG